jgi:hypothetical protein
MCRVKRIGGEPRSRESSPGDRRSPQRSDGAHLGWTAFWICRVFPQ